MSAGTCGLLQILVNERERHAAFANRRRDALDGTQPYVAAGKDSGDGPTDADGSLAQPLGKVGRDVSLEQATNAARLTALAILGSLKRELGDLDRIACWSRIFGMVNSAPGFNRQPAVLNGFTDVIVQVFGVERGAHARSAVGMAELPFNIPVEIEGEVELLPA